MRYTDYPGWTKPYVIVHHTGFGVMEDNYVEHEVVAEADTYTEAVKISKEFTAQNNTPEQIQSSWIPNTYHINVNTLSPDSAPLLEEFHRKADQLHQHAQDNPEMYNTSKVNGITFHMRKHPEFDETPQEPKRIVGRFDTSTNEFNIEEP